MRRQEQITQLGEENLTGAEFPVQGNKLTANHTQILLNVTILKMAFVLIPCKFE